MQVRGYKEHQCKFIFRLADVDLGRLGHVFGLLRMPRMAEIKHAAEALKNFRPSPVDPESVKVCARKIRNMTRIVMARSLTVSFVKHRPRLCVTVREVTRHVELLCPVSHSRIARSPRGQRGLATSCLVPTQFRDKAREKQRQKSLRQASTVAAAQSAPAAFRKPGKVGKRPQQLEEARLPAAKRRLLDGRQDAAELADEYALLRKLKKGKLSEVCQLPLPGSPTSARLRMVEGRLQLLVMISPVTWSRVRMQCEVCHRLPASESPL